MSSQGYIYCISVSNDEQYYKICTSQLLVSEIIKNQNVILIKKVYNPELREMAIHQLLSDRMEGRKVFRLNKNEVGVLFSLMKDCDENQSTNFSRINTSFFPSSFQPTTDQKKNELFSNMFNQPLNQVNSFSNQPTSSFFNQSTNQPANNQPTSSFFNQSTNQPANNQSTSSFFNQSTNQPTTNQPTSSFFNQSTNQPTNQTEPNFSETKTEQKKDETFSFFNQPTNETTTSFSQTKTEQKKEDTVPKTFFGQPTNDQKKEVSQQSFSVPNNSFRFLADNQKT